MRALLHNTTKRIERNGLITTVWEGVAEDGSPVLLTVVDVIPVYPQHEEKVITALCDAVRPTPFAESYTLRLWTDVEPFNTTPILKPISDHGFSDDGSSENRQIIEI